jgi:hypothetical protein
VGRNAPSKNLAHWRQFAKFLDQSLNPENEMNTAKLQKLNELPTDVLIAMKAYIKAVLATRLDTTLRYGSIGEFEYPARRHRKLRVERVNDKTVSGTETDDSFEPGKRWRVSKAAIKVVPKERENPPPMKASVPYKPSNYAGDTW